MAENRGKQFENQIKTAFEKEAWITRLIDPQNGYAGVRNICDFIAYRYPLMYLIECKSHHGNTLPFSCITDNQWKGLEEASNVPGVCAGYIVWFEDKDITYFAPASLLVSLKLANVKSLRFDDSYPELIHIFGKKKRVLWEYDVYPFLERTREIYG